MTSSASCPGWIPAMSVRVASRPMPSAYPSLVFMSSFGSRVISASVSASTPDSERSYLTLCSHTDCMRSMSKRGNFIARAVVWVAAERATTSSCCPDQTSVGRQYTRHRSIGHKAASDRRYLRAAGPLQEFGRRERVFGPSDEVLATADADLGVPTRRPFVLVLDRVPLCD